MTERMTEPAPVPAVVLAPPVPPPPPGWTWSQRVGVSLMVAGPAAMAAGLYYGKKAHDQASEIANYCKGGCEGPSIVPKDQARKRNGLTQWILLGGGAAATATGGALFFLGGADSSETRVSFMLTPGGAGAALARRF